jgi:glycosyltransferase involved in cell wall biosynthesis
MGSPFPNGREWSLPDGATDRFSAAIVMRTKDRPVLLPRALGSVLGQTHQNWHLYLVNDGGDGDSFLQSLAPYEAQFGGRLTIIQHETSRGMEAASNSALAQARGQFLVIHDDDDTWHPDFLTQTIRFLADHNNRRFVAVAARPILIHEKIDGKDVFELKREEWDAWVPMLDMAHILCRNAIPPICLLIRMDAVHEIGTYNEAMPVLGDWDFNLRLLSLGDIGTIEHRLAAYHHRDNGGPVYGNSVTAGLDRHKIYDTLYRNALLREALKDPPLFGALHGLLRMMDEHKNTMRRQLLEQDGLILRVLNDRFDRIDSRLAQIEAKIGALRA